LARDSGDQTASLELDNHLVDCWRRDLEEAPEVGLRWRSLVEQRVRVNEGEVLALPFGKSLS
jgi:hypothetical protein